MAYFPKDYFQGETRDGFYIEPMMKCAWAAMIEVLDVVDEICAKYGIRYFADYGTLLGAVRHQGFIPWDDDMDISMFRNDYEHFLEVAPAELPDGWHLHSIHSNPFHDQLHALVKNTDKIDYSAEHLRRFHGCPYSVGLDIFPLDTLAPTPGEDQTVCELLKVLVHTAQIYEKQPDQAGELIPEIENLCGININRNGAIKSQLMLVADQLCRSYNNSGYDGISHYATYVSQNCTLRMSVSWYQEQICLPFETTTIMVPAGYDNILQVNYGDYMTPVQGIQMHDYPFWKKQERILAECWAGMQGGDKSTC